MLLWTELSSNMISDALTLVVLLSCLFCTYSSITMLFISILLFFFFKFCSQNTFKPDLVNRLTSVTWLQMKLTVETCKLINQFCRPGKKNRPSASGNLFSISGLGDHSRGHTCKQLKRLLYMKTDWLWLCFGHWNKSHCWGAHSER